MAAAGSFAASFAGAAFMPIVRAAGLGLRLSDGLVGTWPASVQPIAQAELRFDHASGLYAALNTEYASRIAVDYANSYWADSHVIFGSRIGYDAPGGRWQLWAEMRNIGDRHYAATVTPGYNDAGKDVARSTPGEGRGVYAGVRWRLPGGDWRAVAKNGEELRETVELELLDTAESRFVSRGGLKLDGALTHCGLDVTGLRCLDVGQSSGGFTDGLLQRGAVQGTGAVAQHGGGVLGFRKAAEDEQREAERLRKELSDLRAKHAKRLEDLERLRAEAKERASEEARLLIRQKTEKMDNIISELRRMGKEGRKTQSARKKMKETSEELVGQIGHEKEPPPVDEADIPTALAKGDTVRVTSLGGVSGVVVENTSGAEAIVQVGVMRVTVPMTGLRIVGVSAAKQKPKAVGVSVPLPDAPPLPPHRSPASAR